MSDPEPPDPSVDLPPEQAGVKRLSVVARLALLGYLVAAAGLVLECEAVGRQFKDWGGALGLGSELASLASSTGEALAWVPILLCFPIVFFLQARYGGAEWGPWGLRVVDLFSDQRGTFLPWHRVESLEEVAGGLRAVPSPEADRLFRLAGPCLIVPPGPARERLLAAIAPLVGRAQTPQVFGAGPSRVGWVALWGGLGVGLPLVVLLSLVVTGEAWGQSADALAMFWAVRGRGAGLVPLRLPGPPRELDPRRALRGGGAASADPRRAAAAAPGRAPAGSAERRELSLQERGRLLHGAAARPRGGGALRRRAPVPRGRARARAALVSTTGTRIPSLWVLGAFLLALGALPALWAWAVPAQRGARISDELGQDLLLVYEELSHRPLLLLALPPDLTLEVRGLRGAYGLPQTLRFGAEPGLLIDVEAGVWRDQSSGASGSLALVASATVAPATSQVRVVTWSDRPQDLDGLEGYLQVGERDLVLRNTVTLLTFRKARKGQTREIQPSLPALLSRYRVRPSAGPLRDYVRGAKSSRVYDLRGVTPDKDLVAGVAQGQVLWVALIPRESSQTLQGSGVGYEIGRGGNLVTLGPGVWRVHVGGALTQVQAQAPSLDALEGLQERLAASEPEGEELLQELLGQR